MDRDVLRRSLLVAFDFIDDIPKDSDTAPQAFVLPW